MSGLEPLRAALGWVLDSHPIVLVGLRASLVLSIAFVASALLRKAPAWHRHALWSSAFLGVLLLPLLTPMLPTLELPVLSGDVMANRSEAAVSPAPSTAPVSEVVSRPASEIVASQRDVAPAAVRSLGFARSLPTLPWGVWVWALGAILALGAVVRGLVRADRMMRSATTLDDPSWTSLLDDVRASLGLRRGVRLAMAGAVPTPMTGGVLRPVVLLPSSARSWTSERRCLVLQHELTHVLRHDWLRQLSAQVARALHWPNPLVWLAVRAAHDAREAACDEGVVALGTRPSTYAGHLLAIGEAQDLHARLPVAALPMIDRSQLERRVMAILDSAPSTRRRAVLGLLAVLLVGGAVLTVAAAQPSVRAHGMAPGFLPLVQSTSWFSFGATSSDVCLGTGSDGTFRGSWSGKDDEGFLSFSGTHNGDRVFQRRLDGGAKLCVRSHFDVDLEAVAKDLRLPTGTWLRIATAGEYSTIEAKLAGTGGEPQITWLVDGQPRFLDATGRAWIERTLDVAAGVQAIQSLRGEAASLRGEIASVRGEAASLRGEIASVRGEEASLRGEIASIRGKRASTEGEIAGIRGELASMRGEVASHRGEIASLRHGHHAGEDADAAAITRHEEAIRVLEAQIESYDVEGRIAAVDRSFSDAEVTTQVADVEAHIATLDVAGQTAGIRDQIAALDVEGQVAALERKIEVLDVDRRVAAMEAELEPRLEALQEILGELGC